jgi:hypothetical protein
VTDLVQPGTTAAYANHGRWVAVCSYDATCGLGAAHLDRFQDSFDCPTCDRKMKVVWPSDSMVYGIERLLLQRPHWKNQNWVPGETLHDLLHENAMHGILGIHAAALSPGSMFGIDGDRIVHDALPTLNPRRELVR